jgi:hypothetical protein
MDEGDNNLIYDQTREILHRFLSCLSNEQATLIDHINNEILSNIDQYAKTADFRRPAEKVEAVFLEKAAQHSKVEQIILKRALVAKLALQLPAIVEKMNLPASILALYPDALGRLAGFLKSAGNEPYDSDGEFFCKDVRFVLGLSIPNGFYVFDILSRVSVPSVIFSAVRSRNVNGIIRYFRAGVSGIWFRGHVDSRYVAEVNERGFDNSFFRLAEVLERKRDIRGYVGCSWLHAPQLPECSPHLAYFQKYPREGGAFLLRHGTQISDIENAIKTSETRRRLYQEGKYMPVCYSLLWPRKELITWARKYQKLSHHD